MASYCTDCQDLFAGMARYRAPAWLPGGHLQTIYPATCIRKPEVGFRRERWDTPCGQDFIDVDFLDDGPIDGRRPAGLDGRLLDGGPRDGGLAGATPAPCHPGLAGEQTDAPRPFVLLFHGLEGSSDSHYARALMAAVRARGWHGAIAHFRGCSGEANLAPRFYHSGDAEELDWIIRRLRTRFAGRFHVAGVSLGGNALLRWLGEQQHGAGIVDAAVAVSAPLDLAAGGAALGSGLNRVYTRMFLETLKPKALAKLERFPGLFDRERLLAARDLYSFDNVVTAPLHGYRDTDDYWHRASARYVLNDIKVPTLVLNARNDPFLPGRHLPASASTSVTLEYPETGGHVGFPVGPFPGRIDWLPRRILHFFEEHAGYTPMRAPAASELCQA